MDKEKLIYYADRGIEFSLIILIFILPFAHTASIRAFCIIFATVLWIGEMAIERRLLLKRTPLDFPNLAFFLWATLSSITAVDPEYSLSQIKGEVGTYLLIFYVTLNNITTEEQVKRLIKSLSLGLLIMSSYGIYQFIIFKGTLVSSSVRISSLTSDYNYLATYLIIAVPLVLLQSFVTKGWLKLCIYLISFLGIFTVYITYTRAAWLALFIQIVLCGLLMRNKKITSLAILIGFIVTTMIFWGIKDPFIHKTTLISPAGEITKVDTAFSRLAIWKEGIQQIKKYPLTGIGYGRESFKKAFHDNPFLKKERGQLWHTHNAFMETALEIGIPGMLFLILQLLLLINIFLRAFLKAKQPFSKFLFMGLLLVIFGFFTRNQFDHLYVDDPVMMFWLLMGMGMALIIRDRKHKVEELMDKKEGT
ncbi:MAG: O-antigen ligase family protein [Thermodesulfovibrionia bacterium]|nr:O-antigen ligase family protein [Thermodesulfovibrionia bacterium]